ncbi:hypothetical protein EVAR_25239_1 [Eumeta japonica]|uniref:Uncharacterized protein n=1 Tax=Eumeta variegata TaxID=151549 RepID=A0A4C1WJ72_EUMVA|nr:hypothetical protein EVAR_25239_1 [Eumeta japonica]
MRDTRAPRGRNPNYEQSPLPDFARKSRGAADVGGTRSNVARAEAGALLGDTKFTQPWGDENKESESETVHTPATAVCDNEKVRDRERAASADVETALDTLMRILASSSYSKEGLVLTIGIKYVAHFSETDALGCNFGRGSKSHSVIRTEPVKMPNLRHQGLDSLLVSTQHPRRQGELILPRLYNAAPYELCKTETGYFAVKLGDFRSIALNELKNSNNRQIVSRTSTGAGDARALRPTAGSSAGAGRRPTILYINDILVVVGGRALTHSSEKCASASRGPRAATAPPRPVAVAPRARARSVAFPFYSPHAKTGNIGSDVPRLGTSRRTTEDRRDVQRGGNYYRDDLPSANYDVYSHGRADASPPRAPSPGVGGVDVSPSRVQNKVKRLAGIRKRNGYHNEHTALALLVRRRLTAHVRAHREPHSDLSINTLCTVPCNSHKNY